MQFYRYYTTSRPPMPGGIPKDGLVGIKAFEARTYIPSLGREVWGFADYKHPLTDAEVSEYELLAPYDYNSFSLDITKLS